MSEITCTDILKVCVGPTFTNERSNMFVLSGVRDQDGHGRLPAGALRRDPLRAEDVPSRSRLPLQAHPVRAGVGLERRQHREEVHSHAVVLGSDAGAAVRRVGGTEAPGGPSASCPGAGSLQDPRHWYCFLKNLQFRLKVFSLEYGQKMNHFRLKRSELFPEVFRNPE